MYLVLPHTNSLSFVRFFSLEQLLPYVSPSFVQDVFTAPSSNHPMPRQRPQQHITSFQHPFDEPRDQCR
ncbi:hypothetical protein Scep_016424 [Stephania cephalantha]|uniref:Uncharacterized protein n=1 Tax=Stephania cephalantha TaxID=152367 RepID=A0AAP0NVU8_9MAGN